MATPVSSGMFGKHNYPLCHLPPSLLEVPYFEGALACAKATKATTCPMEFPALEPQVPSTCACVYESGAGAPSSVRRGAVDPPEPLTTCEANGVFADRDLRSSQTSLLPPLTAHHENLGHMIVS